MSSIKCAKRNRGNSAYDAHPHNPRLAAAKNSPHMQAFGISGLAVWTFACHNSEYTTDETHDLLERTWSLIASPMGPALRPEEIETLVDTTSLLSSVTKPTGTLLPDNARLLLRLLQKYNSEVESHVRLALAVAFTFWGLALDADEWQFWTPEKRRDNWRAYTRGNEREKDTAALFLLGLSRLLEHCSQLMLDHTSISTISEEISRYMRRSSAAERLTLPFLPEDFDVRRHVRETVSKYLRETQEYEPFTTSMTASRDRLLAAIKTDGGEGYVYELPQPFRRREKSGSISDT